MIVNHCLEKNRPNHNCNYENGLKIMMLAFFLFFSIILYSQNRDSASINSLFEKCNLCFQKKEFEKCRGYAEQILELDDSNCNAYIMLGKIYGNIPRDYLAEIMKESIEYNMIYCLAVDMFEKAKEVDTLCRQSADKEIALYSKYFPVSHFGYNNDMIGKEYFIEGWINRKTIIRFKK